MISSRITRNLKQAGNADKIVVVVGTVTNDLRCVTVNHIVAEAVIVQTNTQLHTFVE